jgi:hypothetical protein
MKRLNTLMQSTSSAASTQENSNMGLIYVHLAEYQTLTTRCTYWITMQYAALTVILVYLSFAASLWNSVTDRRLLYWGSALILQVIGLFWMQIQGEQYTAILYIERVLRPALSQAVVHTSQFLCYEPFLARIRKTHRSIPTVNPELYEIPIPIVATVIVLSAFVHALQSNGSRPLLGVGGWLGLIFNVLPLLLLWKRAIEVRRIRLAFTNSALVADCDLHGITL